MRIHHLEMTAFGPFSGTESVDFDALSDAGVFLLCGPTGAGKTSILDAVCFGLYGEVPGDRNAAKRLRSDHAAPGTVPSVRLEMTINGRHFRIRRSPAWQRAKKRGSGTTTEQAKVTLEERVAGSWTHLSNRLDETGHLITELLGMNLTQFTQVAMLPQGRFQSFLRARSEERHKLLQRLFRTGRFEDIEKWLVGRRQSLKAAHERHQDEVSAVVSRLSEAAGAELPPEWDVHDLAALAGEGAVKAWAATLVSEATDALEEADARLTVARGRAEQTRERLEEARAIVDLRERHRRARHVAQTLEAGAAEAAEAQELVDSARRAAAVLPLLRFADEADTQVEQAGSRLDELLADAARHLDDDGEITTGTLADAEREAREAVTLAKALLPRQVELRGAQQALEETASALEQLSRTSMDLAARARSLPERIDELRRLAGEHAVLAGTLDAVRQDEVRLVEALQGARKATSLRRDLDDARSLLRQRVDAAQFLRQQMHDIREARINGMAAELAAALAQGGSCPVCGSAEHPAVARPVAGAPTQADEHAARTAYEDADFARQAQAEAVATLERNLALAEHAAAGKAVDAVEAELEKVRRTLTACRAAGEEEQRLTEQVARLQRERSELETRVSETGREIARQEQRREHARATVDAVSAELSAFLESQDVTDSVERLIEARSAAGAAFAAARDALTLRDSAVARSEEAHRQALACAREHGFDTLDEAAAAALPREAVTALEQRLRRRDEQRAQSEAVLADPQVQAAVEHEPPDLELMRTAAEHAQEDLAACGAAARVARARMERLRGLASELDIQLDAWTPTRAAYSLALSLSTFAEGKGGDNRVQMRLSAYVLAARLQQVVAAANERLRTMSDERYTLEHSANRGVGEQRGGLSLLVRDEWTGESRDPATLSGGETFVTSLALALGLADVVTHEVGGANIETLFIDEGFGSLDPETLDDVMNTLDGLRDGGRVVGIVSHVPEMRTRVAAQLQIRKNRSGSHVVAAREPV